jgi:hypothetical protein
VQLERGQPDAEPDSLAAAEGGEGGDLVQRLWRVRFEPAAAQIGIGLGRVEEETVAVRDQAAHGFAAFLPAPGSAEKALDQPSSGVTAPRPAD